MPIEDIAMELRNTFQQFDDWAFRISVATIIANMMEQRQTDAEDEFRITTLDPLDPVWTLLIGPPSSGKTEALSMVSGFHVTYELLEFTTKSIATGHMKGEHLLPKLTGKTILIKDLSAIFSKRDFEISAILDQLRQIYDGRVRFDWGSGKPPLDWHGKIGLLACATEDIYERRRVFAEMGDRFLYYPIRVPKDTVSRRAIAHTARRNSRFDGVIRRSLREGVHDMLSDLTQNPVHPDMVDVSTHTGHQLDAIAELSTRARSYVPRDFRHQLVGSPQLEGSARMAKSIDLLARALAFAHGRTRVNGLDIAIVRRAAFGATKPIRRALLITLFARWDGGNMTSMRTSELVDATSENRITVIRNLDDLEVLGMIDVERLAGTGSESRTYRKLYRIKPDIGESMREVFGTHNDGLGGHGDTDDTDNMVVAQEAVVAD